MVFKIRTGLNTRKENHVWLSGSTISWMDILQLQFDRELHRNYPNVCFINWWFLSKLVSEANFEKQEKYNLKNHTKLTVERISFSLLFHCQSFLRYAFDWNMGSPDCPKNCDGIHFCRHIRNRHAGNGDDQWRLHST